MLEQKLKTTIRDVADFPKPGILFKDITPILHHPQLCDDIVNVFVNYCTDKNINAVVGVESRGFLFGFALANKLNVPFILVRKSGKLPYKTISYEYDLEYGSAKVEMQEDEIQPGWNVLIHDDLLATGGTAEAAAKLIQMQKGNVSGFAFIVELDFLNGKEKLKQYSENIISLVNY
ncbi:MAG: adenine phosphoribosyltransferase [Bacteroidetes bacterium RIFCSPLOWO2_12_FULL_35_15]|nr:MAG: adenine phosphoribosyltransferase [Bacteroidetes bacterium RIFCSPLOWO2_12_FULL_35_15]